MTIFENKLSFKLNYISNERAKREWLAKSNGTDHLNEDFCFIHNANDWYMFGRVESLGYGLVYADAVHERLARTGDTVDYFCLFNGGDVLRPRLILQQYSRLA